MRQKIAEIQQIRLPNAELRGEIVAALPADQNVFEIGNEVWNYMSMEEFAEWCQMVVPVVKALRPDAVIGPDPGSVERARRFIKAGGMNGMNAYFIHPYSFTPMPEHRVRALLRNVGDFLEIKTGRRFDAYVTEYGWPTAPKNVQLVQYTARLRP